MEKKKRFRPTLTAYRDLEVLAKVQEDTIKDLQVKLAKLRKDYKELMDCSIGVGKYNDLESLADRLRNDNCILTDRLDKANDVIKWLMDRSLWNRIINLPYVHE